MLHTKSMLFINDYKTQVMKFYIPREKAMSANNNINSAFLHCFEENFLFLGALKTRNRFYNKRVLFQAGFERKFMLLSKNGSGYEHSDLLTITHCSKRGAHRDFCLPIPHIAANKTIHNAS